MKMCKRLMACLAVGLVSVVCGTAQADQLVNDFGDGVQSWRTENFGGIGAISQDPTEGSPGNAAGALKLDMPFPAQKFAFTGDVFQLPESGTDLSGFDNLEFDLKIAPGSALDAFGDHGFLDFVSRETNGFNWNPILSENLTPATGWRTFSAPASSLTATRAFTLQLFGGDDKNIQGNITLFLDNIRLTGTAVPEPSTVMIVAIAALCAPLGRRR